jgi:hypothetical protein
MKNKAKGTNTSKRTFNDTLSEQGRTSIEKGCSKGLRGAGFGKPFEDADPEKITKNTYQKTCKNQSWENIKKMTKQCQKGARNHSFLKLFRRGNFRQLSVLPT